VATIPTIPTEAPGNFITSALWNANVLGGFTYLFAPVRFRAYSSTAQTLATGTTGVALTFDTEIVDSDGGHSTVTNTSRYTAQTAGLYWVSGQWLTGSTSGTGTRATQIWLNGTAIPGSTTQFPASASNGGGGFAWTVVPMAVGDYVEIAAWQNSGGNLSTANSNLGVSSSMTVARFSA
jgi:hypothetical protein